MLKVINGVIKLRTVAFFWVIKETKLNYRTVWLQDTTRLSISTRKRYCFVALLRLRV